MKVTKSRLSQALCDLQDSKTYAPITSEVKKKKSLSIKNDDVVVKGQTYYPMPLTKR